MRDFRKTKRIDLNDVFSPKLGFELQTTEWLALRAGAWWRNSRTKDQSNLPTNLIDSDKFVFTVGAGLSFGEPPQLMSEEVEHSEGDADTLEEKLVDASADLDVFFQYHWHTSVSATKPAGDPVGNWDADGGIINFGLILTIRF